MKGESCLLSALVFDRFSKGAVCEKSLFSTGRNDRLMPDKLLSLIGHIGNRIGGFSVSVLRYAGDGIFSSAWPIYQLEW